MCVCVEYEPYLNLFFSFYIGQFHVSSSFIPIIHPLTDLTTFTHRSSLLSTLLHSLSNSHRLYQPCKRFLETLLHPRLSGPSQNGVFCTFTRLLAETGFDRDHFGVLWLSSAQLISIVSPPCPHRQVASPRSFTISSIITTLLSPRTILLQYPITRRTTLRILILSLIHTLPHQSVPMEPPHLPPQLLHLIWLTSLATPSTPLCSQIPIYPSPIFQGL